MPDSATNTALYSLNCLTSINLTKPLILTQRPVVGEIGVALVGEETRIRTFIKPANEARRNQDINVWTKDTFLKDIPVSSGKSYKVDFYIACFLPLTFGCKARLIAPLPTGTLPIQAGFVNTLSWGNGSAGSADNGIGGAGSPPSGYRYITIANSGVYNAIRAITGTIYTGVLQSSGDLSLAWTQLASGAIDTIMQAGSTLIVTELENTNQ